MPSEDQYAHEVIKTVRDMMELLTNFRNDVNRAMIPLYPRITEIEKRLADEARERPARQRELDAKLRKQDTALAQIDERMDRQDEQLMAQDRALDTIYKAQKWRTPIQIGIAVLLLFVAFELAQIVGWL